MLATIPGFILTGVLEETVMRGILFRILEQWLGSWIALGISAAAGVALLRLAAKKDRFVPAHARPARRSSVTMARNPPAQ
jgi:Type II CAAX prenyl endopeptidase Rce1-like